ncbi:MAG TPA: hypothetical protein VL991_10905 [Terracidiphilus sp.]|nr:hypothetical protein [Terracidiphilus sp.]
MEPTISTSGTAGAGQTAQDQSLSPQTNANQATQRANANRGPTQEGASFSGPANQTGQEQTGYGSSNNT